MNVFQVFDLIKNKREEKEEFLAVELSANSRQLLEDYVRVVVVDSAQLLTYLNHRDALNIDLLVEIKLRDRASTEQVMVKLDEIMKNGLQCLSDSELFRLATSRKLLESLQERLLLGVFDSETPIARDLLKAFADHYCPGNVGS